VPPVGLPKLLASLMSDFAMDGIVADATSVYWLTSKGSVYKLPRTSLR
jgi:hypothetical protein